MALARHRVTWAHFGAGLLWVSFSLLASHLSPMHLMLLYVLDLPVTVPLRAAELGMPCVEMLGDEPKHPLKTAPGKAVCELAFHCFVFCVGFPTDQPQTASVSCWDPTRTETFVSSAPLGRGGPNSPPWHLYSPAPPPLLAPFP